VSHASTSISGLWVLGLCSYLLSLSCVVTLLSYSSDQKFWLLHSWFFNRPIFFFWIFFVDWAIFFHWRSSGTCIQGELNSNLKFKIRLSVENRIVGHSCKGSPCRHSHPIRLYVYPERFVIYATCKVFTNINSFSEISCTRHIVSAPLMLLLVSLNNTLILTFSCLLGRA